MCQNGDRVIRAIIIERYRSYIINRTGAMETRQVSVIFLVIYLCTNKNAQKSFNQMLFLLKFIIIKSLNVGFFFAVNKRMNRKELFIPVSFK